MHPTLAARKAAATSWTLANGSRIPNIGFGTWKLKKDQAGPAVSQALKTGYRHLDCAWAYRNEDAVGAAIKQSGVKRDDLWITSKLWNTFHGDKVEAGLDATLKDLGVDYLDLYLMHWPVAFSNPNVDQIASLKSQGGHPVEEPRLSQNLALTWSHMEAMVKKGKVRNIGISNFNIRRTEELLKTAEIEPLINQVEVNLGVANEELLQYSEAHRIMLQAYSPLGGSNMAEKYREDPVIADVAARNNMTPAQVQIAWPIARGIIPIVKSQDAGRIAENFEAAHKALPWDDVLHLTRESQSRPIERSVDPTEAWDTKEDIFEDYHDQHRLNALKQDSLEIPPAHETDGSHYLEPRNDPEATPITPAGTAVRSFHTSSAARSPLASGSRPRATAVQQLMQGRRTFASSSSSAAVAEAAPPTAGEAPVLGESPLLRTTSKAALKTPGLVFADGQEGVERETRKINLYTVGASSRALSASTISSSLLGSAASSSRSVASSSSARAFSSSAASSASEASSTSGLYSKKARTYTPRKALLFEQYGALLDECASGFVLVLRHENLSVSQFAKIRKDLAAIPVPEGASTTADAGVGRRHAKIEAVRSGLLRPLLRDAKEGSMRRLNEEGHLRGPVALLTCPSLSPDYLSRVLSVLDRHAGSKQKAGAPAGGKAAADVKEARLTPLAALIEGSYMDVAATRDVSKLPSLDTLRSQLVGLLSMPAAQLAGILSQASGGDVALTLEARKRDLEKQEPTSA